MPAEKVSHLFCSWKTRELGPLREPGEPPGPMYYVLVGRGQYRGRQHLPLTPPALGLEARQRNEFLC